MLLEGVNFDSGDEFERDGASPSPKKKTTPVQKRKRGEEEEEEEKEDKEEQEEKEKKENKRIRRGGSRWNREGRHVENVSVTTTMQFGTPMSFIQSLLMQISSWNITIINNYYYGGNRRDRGQGRGGQGQSRGQGREGQGQGQRREGWGKH